MKRNRPNRGREKAHPKVGVALSFPRFVAFAPFRCLYGPKSRFGCVQASPVVFRSGSVGFLCARAFRPSPVVFRSGSVGFLCALPFVFQEGLDSFSGRGFGKPGYVVLLSAFVPSRVHPRAYHPWFGVSPVREGYVALATRVRGGKRAKPSRCTLITPGRVPLGLACPQ